MVHVRLSLLPLLIGIGSAALAAEHPRLYFRESDLAAMRTAPADVFATKIRANLIESAEWCLQKTPRGEYIAPVAEDPVYENLYDRFYAMMQDMSITEHLAFTYAFTGEARYGEAARAWALASCRSWRPDAEAPPNDGSAYAVCRMLKGVAVAYDLLYPGFTEAERTEIRELLAKTAATYYSGYFQRPEIQAETFHTHHAIVQFGSFGIVALALLDEVPEAQTWLDATVKKYVEHILPRGLAPDGAQIEGATFWASTMHYRLFFMDALRRVTGRDLYKEFATVMNADLALASIAGEMEHGLGQPHESVVFEPPYGQLDYYSPVLVALAREYRRPIYQYLAQWDHSLGHLQQTRYITPNKREQLLFELGGYALLWYDPTVPVAADEKKLTYVFESVGQAYTRAGWTPGGLLAALDKTGQLVVHAGGVPVLVAAGPANWPAAELRLSPAEDDGTTARLGLLWGSDRVLDVQLTRPNTVKIAVRKLEGSWSFWRYQLPLEHDEEHLKDAHVTMHWTKGRITGLAPEGNKIPMAVGNGLLALYNPAPMVYPVVAVTLEEGAVEINVTTF